MGIFVSTRISTGGGARRGPLGWTTESDPPGGWTRIRTLAVAALCAAMALTGVPAFGQDPGVPVPAPPYGPLPEGGIQLNESDLDFILRQIQIAEAHPDGLGVLDTIGSPQLPFGLRTIDGRNNNLLPNQADFGSTETPFVRTTDPYWREAEPKPITMGGDGVTNTRYDQPGDVVVDTAPRVISNLIVDQTSRNPAAEAIASDPDSDATEVTGGCVDPTGSIAASGDPCALYEFPNHAPDEGLSAPFNAWFTFFGQFFDHGLDLIAKGGNGIVMVPLMEDDPLYVEGSPKNFMVLTRATLDGNGDFSNFTSPFVDQNQTYTSHPSHHVFVREYELQAGRPVATGRLIEGASEGLANWDEVKAQARDILGIELDDLDALDVPMLATDAYGNFTPDPTTGFPLIVTPSGNVAGSIGAPVDATDALPTGHAFLLDIAHTAVPVDAQSGAPLAPDADVDATDTCGPHSCPAGLYDDELFGAHFIAGDGRINENIALTAVHHVFHSEHNRLVLQIQHLVDETGHQGWRNADGTWNGNRLFSAAKFVTEMEYQHLVFEEFGRKVQPAINVFSNYDTQMDPTITAEFSQAVYRFGHSMLNETVNRTDPSGASHDLTLIEAFLNPNEYLDLGGATPVTSAEAAGAIAQGVTAQAGNEIDEFITDALRTNLLGLPLDLASINIMRGRDTGLPSLNEARRQFYAASGHPDLRPYESWRDFQLSMRNPESFVNFVAAYGTHPTITSSTTLAAKRDAATRLVTGVGDAGTVPEDRTAFLNSQVYTPEPVIPEDPTLPPEPVVPIDWATNPTGVDDIDLWMGGLAERTQPFGGMLGSTFNYVFETQLEALQEGDRFYYLHRLAGENLLTQLEENSFSEMVMRNTTATNLPFDVFSVPDMVFDLGADPLDPALTVMNDGTIRYHGGAHVNMIGTSGNDRMRAGDGDDSLWGHAGDDYLEGGSGNDAHVGGPGNDILFDLFGDDNLKGGSGDDAIHAGSGEDLILAGSGNDFVIAGADPKETFGGEGHDFIYGGDGADTVFGDRGHDWIEGGNQADLLQGDHGAPFQDDEVPGNDVIIGGGGNDDYDAEGGDDIMVADAGTERNEGMLGYDWVTYKDDPVPVNTDMTITGLLPPDVADIADRFDLVEGLSGWKYDDVLRGDDPGRVGDRDDDPNRFVGHELRDLDLITGLRAIVEPSLPPGKTIVDNGNIILGGGGSDVLEGRAGDDILHGDAWLNVQLEAEGVRYDSMQQLKGRVFDRSLPISAISIVREILIEADPVDGPAPIDTAVFSDVLANYDIRAHLDGRRVVTHTGGTATDGSDTLWGIERLVFADQTIDVVPGGNTPATGPVLITGLPPVEGSELMADTSGMFDADGIDLTTVDIQWQVGETGGTFAGTAASGTSFTPTQEHVGKSVRIVVTFLDNTGTLETLTSEPTAPVVDVNNDPTGEPEVTPATLTTHGETVSVSVLGIADADGLTTPSWAYQWQEGTGGVFTDIPGATADTLTATQSGQMLRVVVRFTDDGGVTEELVSDPVGPVPAPPVVTPPPGDGGGTPPPPPGGGTPPPPTGGGGTPPPPVDSRIIIDAPAGGTVSSGEGSGITSPSDPVQVDVQTPVAGTVEIRLETLEPLDTPEEFHFLGLDIDIKAPDATADDPLVMTFTIDPSAVPQTGEVTVFRNGAEVLPCTSATGATPDPCVASTQATAGGGLRITIRTSQASLWSFAAPPTCPEGTVTASAFADIDGSVHASSIECMVWLELAKGVTASQFGPSNATTRGQTATLIAGLLERMGVTLPEPTENRFTDDDGHTHEANLEALAELGIVKGVAADRVAPNAPVTRSQFMAMLVRASELALGRSLPAGTDAFDDDGASVHQATLNRAAAAGLALGVGDRMFDPSGEITRGQVATFVIRALDIVGREPDGS